MEVNQLENLIREILAEKLGENVLTDTRQQHNGVIRVSVPRIQISPSDRMNTNYRETDQVYTKDLFSLSESPRLGCGIMEMKETTFPWLLKYDEIDYIIEGSLTIEIDNKKISAQQGELILIPKGSQICFSAPDFARFLYITYPANWANL